VRISLKTIVGTGVCINNLSLFAEFEHMVSLEVACAAEHTVAVVIIVEYIKLCKYMC
jgi:hypothetical protein